MEQPSFAGLLVSVFVDLAGSHHVFALNEPRLEQRPAHDDPQQFAWFLVGPMVADSSLIAVIQWDKVVAYTTKVHKHG